MATTFTTTLSPDILNWLRKKSEEENKTIRCLLEEAVGHYQLLEKREKLQRTFMAAQSDPEMLAMAEEGLGDSKAQFDQLAS